MIQLAQIRKQMRHDMALEKVGPDHNLKSALERDLAVNALMRAIPDEVIDAKINEMSATDLIQYINYVESLIGIGVEL